MLGRDEPPPDWSVDLAKGSYGLRAVDAELAVLTSDSGLATAQSVTRSGAAPRLAVFDAADLSVEIEIEPGAGAGAWQLSLVCMRDGMRAAVTQWIAIG
jgi:hypothetical protein